MKCIFGKKHKTFGKNPYLSTLVLHHKIVLGGVLSHWLIKLVPCPLVRVQTLRICRCHIIEPSICCQQKSL